MSCSSCRASSRRFSDAKSVEAAVARLCTSSRGSVCGGRDPAKARNELHGNDTESAAANTTDAEALEVLMKLRLMTAIAQRF
mmetsp:Transcript_795/g.1990  ORF Transcript_795/g.1990 Transcript_795/m.1990 type:complete len:82 (-) Transcript_795:4-249(-)